MDDARSRLIASTQDLLWERGYTGTSPKAIQERAGVGQGSMYHHFTGKADLARAAIEQTAQEFLPRWRQHLDGPRPALERIAAYLRAEREVLRGCRVGRLVQDKEVVDDPRLREPIDGVLSGAIERVAAVVREGQEAGEIRSALDPEQVATTLVSVIQGGYVVARAHQDEARFTAAIEGVLALLRAD